MHFLNAELKILHRDLKGDNVFLNRDKNDKIKAIIGDFGLAIMAGTNNKFEGGTPEYMVYF